MAWSAVLFGAQLGISALSNRQKARNERRNLEAQARVAQTNALLARRRARQAIINGSLEATRVRGDGTRLRKTQESLFASANISSNNGSPLDVIYSSSVLSELDASLTRNNAEIAAADFRIQARNEDSLAANSFAGIKNVRAGAFLNFAGDGLTAYAGYATYKTLSGST